MVTTLQQLTGSLSIKLGNSPRSLQLWDTRKTRDWRGRTAEQFSPLSLRENVCLYQGI